VESVNVVFVGHVDHGKSTTIGRLLYDSDSVATERVEEIQKFAEELKRKFEFAYFLDALEEERKDRMTIDTTRVVFKGKNRLYTIIDSPGHKGFLKNMLTGASQADMAILVVSAKEGIQEQTRRHMFLVSLLGIKQVVVAVNKMDAVGYNRGWFERIKDEMKKFLNSLGYDAEKISFVPISAMEGDNVYRRSEKMGWFDGTLIEALDKIVAHEKLLAEPLRFSVQDVYEVDEKQLVVGRVESNILRKGDQVVFQPSGIQARVEKIEVFDGELEEAGVGDAVGLNLSTSQGVGRGEVCGRLDDPPRAVDGFSGEMVLLSGDFRKGETIAVRCGTANAKCEVEEISKKINSETGEPLEDLSEVVRPNEAAIVKFRALEPFVVEKFSDIPELGRFVVVKNDKNVGAGVVLEAGG
jgi:translation elongation factor EF-1 alpha